MFVLWPVRPNQKMETCKQRLYAASCPRATSLKRPTSGTLDEDESVMHTLQLLLNSPSHLLKRTGTLLQQCKEQFILRSATGALKYASVMSAGPLWLKAEGHRTSLEKLTGDTQDYRQTLTISYHNFCCIGFSHYILGKNGEEPESLKHLCTSRYWMWLDFYAGTQSVSCVGQMPR